MNKTARLKLARVVAARYLEASSMWKNLGDIPYTPLGFTNNRKHLYDLNFPNKRQISDSAYRRYYDATRGFKISLPADDRDLRHFESIFYAPKDDSYDFEFEIPTKIARTRHGVFDPEVGRVRWPGRDGRVSVMPDGRIFLNGDLVEGGEQGFMGFKGVEIRLKATNHAQHRMDERGITFDTIQKVLTSYFTDAVSVAGKFPPYHRTNEARRYWGFSEKRSQNGFREGNEFTFRIKGHQIRCSIRNYYDSMPSLQHSLFYVGKTYKNSDTDIEPLKLDLEIHTVI